MPEAVVGCAEFNEIEVTLHDATFSKLQVAATFGFFMLTVRIVVVQATVVDMAMMSNWFETHEELKYARSKR